MANNRMYLKCLCGESFYLVKYYPSTGWYQSTGLEALPSEAALDYMVRFADFLDAHRTCSGAAQVDANYGDNFRLEYESRSKPTWETVLTREDPLWAWANRMGREKHATPRGAAPLTQPEGEGE